MENTASGSEVKEENVDHCSFRNDTIWDKYYPADDFAIIASLAISDL
jgi:hypothetical protein